MTQVFDASALVGALVATNADGRWCEERLAEDDLAAPSLLAFEVANILRRFEARGDLDPSAARLALATLRDLPMVEAPFDAVAGRVWELRANLTVYDASYVALAEGLDCRLVTLDGRLARAPGFRCEVLVAP